MRPSEPKWRDPNVVTPPTTIERAEPSRGAPDAAPHEPDAFEAAWLDYNKRGVAGGWEKVAFTSGFGRGFKAGRETGHVVLLEALRHTLCEHSKVYEDLDFNVCRGCGFRWNHRKSLQRALRDEAEAAINQAERT